MGIFFKNGPESDGRGGRRVKATFMLGLLAFALVASTLVGVRPVKAQYTDPITSIQTTTTNIWTTIKDAFVEAAVTAVVNGVNYFASQMAYTLAVSLTSDCPGQIVCWNSKAFEDGFKQAWQGAIGEAVGTLSQQGGFQKLGFDLCNPSIKFALKIQLGALDEIKPPPPKCDFGALVNNWSNFKDSVSSGEVLKGLKPTFEKGQSGLSIALGAQSGLYEVKEEAKREDIMKRIMDASAGGGFSDVRDPVSGRAKAPSSVVHEQFQQMRKDQESGKDTSASYTAGQIASKAVISVVINAVQTFAMTLISRLLNKLINGLMSTEELIAIQPDLILNPEGLLQPPGTTGAAEAMESRFSAAQPRETGLMDPLLEFSVCPGANRGPNNCVVDQQFANAIRVADVTPVTVKQAIDKNMLHGDWPLYPSSNQIKDQDPFCYTYGYCESNLKKLRAARAIPVGWEIAAEKAGSNTTLREIVNGFHQCNEQGVADAAHPWCHLIDPDWVLKIPPTQCRAMAYGAVPLSSSIPSRAEQCVDTQTCLKQDDNGSCVGGWGYCARERNVWRFNGDSCPAAYNTCRTLKSRTGDIRNYILNTIDHGVCNADNAGCHQYGLDLSTISCSLTADCGDAAGCLCKVVHGGTCKGGSTVGKACTYDRDCSGGGATCVTCSIGQNQTSCAAADGTVCRQPYPCSGTSCDCTTSVSCRVAKDQRSCSSLTGDTQTGDDWQLEPSRFLNKNARTCDATDNGCSGLIKLEAGQSLNLVKNGSFEEAEDGDNSGSPDHAKSWTPFADQPVGSAGYLRKDGAKASQGSNSVLLPTSVVTDVCTVPAGDNVDSATGNCKADLGCPCAITSGTLSGYTCKVVKGHSKCFVTNAVTQDDLPVSKGTTFTVSAVFVPDSGTSVHGRMGLSFRDANGADVTLAPEDVVSTIDITSGHSTCQAGSNPGTECTSNSQCTGGGTCGRSCAVSGGNVVFTVAGERDPLAAGLRASCTFVITNKDILHAMLSVSATSGTLYADTVQFEEGGGTTFHDGYGFSESSPVNLKVPPAFLGCTGDEGDRPECASFAGVCRESEVGCDGYSPDNGDPTIPGIAGPQDSCPSACAGYDIFKQEETDFDAAKFPVFFIPTTAKQCTQNAVGCSEFTNVDTEAVEYYSRLRLCVKPNDPSVGSYYSWEGSDTTGYQLRVWSLKNTAGVVASSATSDVCALKRCSISTGKTCSTDADCTAGEGTCSLACADAGFAPCTRLDGNAENCASKTQANPSGATDGLCDRAAIDAGDLDCREFYDAAGNRHYRVLSKTIIASASCNQYRITVSTQPDCTKSNGRWDAAKGQCIYFADASQSRVCSKPQNNCRAYKGNAATNVHSLLNENFESGITGWTDASDNTSANLTQSGEAVTVGGHSLKIGGTGVRHARIEIGGMVAPGRSYTLTFWARGLGLVTSAFQDGNRNVSCTLSSICANADGCGCTTTSGLSCRVTSGSDNCTIYKAGSTPTDGICLGGTAAGSVCAPTGFTNCISNGGTCSVQTNQNLDFSDGDPLTNTPSVNVTSDWKQYSLGPVIANPPASSGYTPWGGTTVKLDLVATGICSTNGSSCSSTPCAGGGTCQMADIFVDNVNLKEVQDSIYVVRDSWKTPASCDQTADGIPSPQEMLGCRKYTKTSDRSVAYLKSFTNLCREKAIGCGAFSSTQNTPQNPYEESFNAVCRLYDDYGSHGVLPRKCGSLICIQDQCHNPAGCSCTRGSKSCTILNEGTSCDIPVPADAGAACVCDYNKRNPAVTSSEAPEMLSDVCRVGIGSTDCRFKLDRWDDSTRQDESPDRVNVPADKRMYLVATQETQCSAEAVGCRAMGLPHMNFDDTCTLPPTGTDIASGICNNVSGCTCTMNGAVCTVTQGEKQCKVAYELGVVDKWSATAIKDEPAKYDQTLCGAQTLNCEEYSASDGTYYFKNPVDKVCEFKENVTVNGRSVSGFFRKSTTGANFPCYPEFLNSGTFYAMYKNADPTCTLANVTTTAPFTTSNPRIVSGKCQEDAGCLCAVAPNPVPVCRVFKGNTTCGYQGWVGQCEAKYDRCEEFIDPAATSAAHPNGEPYYYIINTKLDLKSCAGKASLKQGCVLFKQTSKTENIYSAAATYYRSLSEANSGLVGPVNCNNDPRNAACEQRCVSYPNGRCSETTDKTCLNDTDDPVKGCPGATNHCEGTKKYGTGCSVANGNGDRDCNVSLGEVCASLMHCHNKTAKFCDSDLDCGADGPCDNPGSPTQHIPKEDSIATKNDTNLIIKVRADRECAQWLACGTYEQEFDVQKNKWRPRCTAFTLCDSTTDPAANSLECSGKVQPEKKVFTADDYVKRDVTYGGLEYSGYSIPGVYPAQYLSPVVITTGQCYDGNTPSDPYVPCKNSSDCTGTQFCKQLGGLCRGDKEGRSCDNDSVCGNGFCSMSFFDTRRFGILLDQGQTCATDDDCDGLDGCGAAEIAQASVATRASEFPTCTKTNVQDDGACVQHRCYYNYSGGKFKRETSTQRAQCRAYPENDAPYTDAIVDKDSAPHKGFDPATWQAVAKKAQYAGVNVCTFKNDCECSYQRLDYKGGITRFVSQSGALLPNTSLALDSNNMVVSQTFDTTIGVCSGGDNDGRTCASTAACPDGTCEPLKKIAKVQGWPGFCIDDDHSISINGDPNQYNCNVWLPVDQLAGAPDVFNQYREAGFKPTMENLLYCAVAAGNRHSSLYYKVMEPNEVAMPSPCISAGYCTGKNETDCNNARNNVGAPWSNVGLGLANTSACWWDGGSSTCKNRVNGTVFGVDFKSGTSADRPPDYPAFLDGFFGPWGNKDACEKVGIAIAHLFCDTAAMAVVLANPVYALGPAAATGATCFAIFQGWCADSGFNTCNGSADAGGDEFFHTSWQDATATSHDVSGDHIKKDQIVAAVVEFKANSDASGVMSRMFLHNNNNYAADIRFADNCDNGLCSLSSQNGKAFATGGNEGSCLNLLQMNANGQDIEGTCEGLDSGSQHNCVGARLEFDGTDEVKRIRTVLCHNDSTIWHRVSARVVFLFREACTEVIQAHDSTKNLLENFAWTDRLWKAKNGTAVAGVPGTYTMTVDAARGADPADLAPYGPITPAMAGDALTSLAWPVPPYPPAGGAFWTALRFGGPDPLPPCIDSQDDASDGYQPDNSAVYKTYCDNYWTTVAGDPGYPPPAPNSMPDGTHLKKTAAGQSFACTGDCAGSNSNAGVNAEANAISALSKLFVSSWGKFTYSPTGAAYVHAGDVAYDQRWLFAKKVDQPRIVPPAGSGCDPSNEGLCPEGTWVESTNGGFEITGVQGDTRQTQPSETASAGGGRTVAYFRYYAYASDDHMPLRRKIVDFGDGTPPAGGSPGWFKNHRGCPSTGICNTTNQICKSDTTKPWGVQPQACENRYFQDVHTYTCSPQQVQTLPECNGKTYPCSDGTACRFRPRIQFLDNWGECNGTCHGGIGNVDMCFNAAHDLGLDPPILDPIAENATERNECVGLDSSGGADNYEFFASTDTIKPWTEGAEIILNPQ